MNQDAGFELGIHRWSQEESPWPANCFWTSCVTDAVGIPLAVTISAANTHDVMSALPTVVDVPPVKGKPGRPRTRPTLVADKAYDAKDFRALLKWLGIHPIIPHRGDSSRGLGKVRWPVERTIAWLHQFRRLRIRWDILEWPVRALNEILNGKKAITPETAQELAAAFGTSAALWLNFESGTVCTWRGAMKPL